nr:DUF4968 domain-containing protein [Bacteroidia bacterium]
MDFQATNKKNYPSEIIEIKRTGNVFLIETANCSLEVQVYSSRIIRFRYGIDYLSRDFSYAKAPDFNFTDTPVELIEDDKQLVIKTSEVVCHIERDTMSISLFTIDGRLINCDDGGFHWEPNPGYGGHYVYCTK